jgi:hypothetical protein
MFKSRLHLISVPSMFPIKPCVHKGMVWLIILSSFAWSLSGCIPVKESKYVNTYAETDSEKDEGACIATDKNGNWYTVWASMHPLGTLGTDWDVFGSWDRSNGKVWSNASPVNSNAANDGTDGDLDPALAIADNGTMVAVWSSTNNNGNTIGDDLDIWFTRNSNIVSGGWDIEKPLHQQFAKSDGKWDDDESPSIATDNKGNWVVVWMQRKTDDADLLYSYSSDDGVSWSSPKTLNSDAATDTKFDYSPQIATDGLGNWLVVWSKEGELYGEQQILVSKSTDAGKNWSAQKHIHPYAFGFNPRIASGGNKTWIIVWSSIADVTSGSLTMDANIHISRSTDDGANWTAPAYLNTDWPGSGSGIWIPIDSNPDLASDGKGNWVAVWDLWQGTTPLAPDIRIAYSSDNGVTWTAPEYLNPDWSQSTLSERYARVATDQKGNWIVIWQTAAHVNGNTSQDSDIAVARFTFPNP